MNRYLKILIPFLLALAVVFGFIQRKEDTSINLVKSSSESGDLQSYFQKAQDVAAVNTKTTATFLAVGDIMLSRNVADTIKKANNIDLPFKNMADVLKSTHFNFANFESPVAPTAASQVIGGHSLIFGAPASYAQGLADYNFKILNLANNHAFDQGLKGINVTSSTLDSLGLLHEGTGTNLDQAWAPAVVSANGIKICFIGASFASQNDGGKTTSPYVARIEDLTHLKSSITLAKTQCDFTVVTMHAGIEYTRTPIASQTTFAHAAVDDGADIVIGAHPHWVQTVEKYDGKYIFYSLGNFIFDQEWSQETKEGLTLKITISKPESCSVPIYGQPASSDADKSARYNCPDLQGQRQPATLDSIELMPVILENSSTPRPATPTESKNILQKIGETETVLK